jgi:ribonuclease-3
VVLKLYRGQLDTLDVTGADKDPKTRLQEWLQARRVAVPDYSVIAITGEAHAQTFAVECRIAALGVATRGEGNSRRTAEQAAAVAAWTALRAGAPGSHER